MRPSRRNRSPRHAWGFETVESRLLLALDQPADFYLDYLVDSQVSQEAYTSLLDAHALTGLNQVQTAYGFSGRGQTVVVIDSGIAYDHAALGRGLGADYQVVAGYDFAERDADPYDDGPAGSHGTHVAGIIASNDSTHPGVAPGVDLVALRVFDDGGQGYFQWVEEALQWVHNNRNSLANPITTVNLSLGGDWNADGLPPWATLEDELAQLDADGIFVAVAAGNSFASYNQPGLGYPASSSHVVPVASVDSDGNLSFFSQRHGRAIAAPGQSILSAVPDYVGNRNGVADDYARYSGTSMAAPYVAGASVLLREALQFAGYTGITQKTIYDLMSNTADTIYDAQTAQSYHRLNLQRAMDWIMPADDFGSTAAGAYALGTIHETRTISGAITRRDDQDWFTFVAGRSGTVTWTASATDEMAAAWAPGSGGAGATIGADNRLSFNVVAGQSYAIGLTTGDGVGSYTLESNLGGSAGDRTNWGAVDQGRFEDYRLDTAGQWFTLTAAAGGLLSVEALFSHAAGDVDLQLFDAAQQLVGTAYTTDDVERIDLTAVAGQTFRLHAYVYGAGVNDEVDFRVTNLVTVDGSNVQVRGTSGADTFSFSTDNTGHHVSINGVTYDFSRTGVGSVAFTGGGGEDVAVLEGTSGNETAVLRPGAGELSGPGYQVRAAGAGQVTIRGNGGADQLTVYDSSGDDVLVASPDSTRLITAEFAGRADGFAQVQAYSNAGGSDVAKLYDSAGDDILVATPRDASLSGPGFALAVEGFEAVTAMAWAGGRDVATLYDSAGDDTFLATPAYASLYGEGFYNRARLFDAVHASATGGGHDTARLYDSASDDTFVGTASFGELAGHGFSNRASYFDAVFAYAGAGGSDAVQLRGSQGDDTLVISAGSASLMGDGFSHRAKYFAQVDARGEGGYDHAILYDSAGNDRFQAAGSQAVLTMTDMAAAMYGFEYVRAISHRGGSDTAEVAAVDFILELAGMWIGS